MECIVLTVIKKTSHSAANEIIWIGIWVRRCLFGINHLDSFQKKIKLLFCFTLIYLVDSILSILNFMFVLLLKNVLYNFIILTVIRLILYNNPSVQRTLRLKQIC